MREREIKLTQRVHKMSFEKVRSRRCLKDVLKECSDNTKVRWFNNIYHSELCQTGGI